MSDPTLNASLEIGHDPAVPPTLHLGAYPRYDTLQPYLHGVETDVDDSRNNYRPDGQRYSNVHVVLPDLRRRHTHAVVLDLPDVATIRHLRMLLDQAEEILAERFSPEHFEPLHPEINHEELDTGRTVTP